MINAAAYTAVDAAETDEDRAFAVNADGPRVLAAACASRRVPLIHVSTDYVFSGDATAPYEPSDELGPRSAYGRTKAAGEDAVLGSGASSWVVRTGWLYGQSGLELREDHGAPGVFATRNCPLWTIRSAVPRGPPIWRRGCWSWLPGWRPATGRSADPALHQRGLGELVRLRPGDLHAPGRGPGAGAAVHDGGVPPASAAAGVLGAVPGIVERSVADPDCGPCGRSPGDASTFRASVTRPLGRAPGRQAVRADRQLGARPPREVGRVRAPGGRRRRRVRVRHRRAQGLRQPVDVAVRDQARAVARHFAQRRDVRAHHRDVCRPSPPAPAARTPRRATAVPAPTRRRPPCEGPHRTDSRSGRVRAPRGNGPGPANTRSGRSGAASWARVSQSRPLRGPAGAGEQQVPRGQPEPRAALVVRRARGEPRRVDAQRRHHDLVAGDVEALRHRVGDRRASGCRSRWRGGRRADQLRQFAVARAATRDGCRRRPGRGSSPRRRRATPAGSTKFVPCTTSVEPGEQLHRREADRSHAIRSSRADTGMPRARTPCGSTCRSRRQPRSVNATARMSTSADRRQLLDQRGGVPADAGALRRAAGCRRGAR